MVNALMFQLAQWRMRLRQAHPDHLRIARGLMRVSAFVLLGKCAGALKEMVVAYQYGVSNVVDAYQFTVTLVTWLPGTILTVLSAVLIPVFVNLRAESREHQAEFIGELEGAALLTGAITGLGLCLLWPVVMHTMGGKLPEATREMCRQMMLGMLPSGILMLTAGIYAAQLQARERHINTLLEGVPATAILLSVLIAGKSNSIVPLVFGTIFGFVVQALWLRSLTTKEYGVRGKIRFSLKSPEWTSTMSAIKMLMIGQVALCFCAPLDQYFMARLGEGANGTLGYANRVLALLLSMGAMAAARATLPILSDILNQGDIARARRTAVTWTLIALACGAVCAAVSWLVAPSVIAVLFERGAWRSPQCSGSACCNYRSISPCWCSRNS
jgi:putative peptidoglycan lipid II flippase